MGINPEIYIGSFEDNSCIEYLEAKIHRLEEEKQSLDKPDPELNKTIRETKTALREIKDTVMIANKDGDGTLELSDVGHRVPAFQKHSQRISTLKRQIVEDMAIKEVGNYGSLEIFERNEMPKIIARFASHIPNISSLTEEMNQSIIRFLENQGIDLSFPPSGTKEKVTMFSVSWVIVKNYKEALLQKTSQGYDTAELETLIRWADEMLHHLESGNIKFTELSELDSITARAAYKSQSNELNMPLDLFDENPVACNKLIPAEIAILHELYHAYQDSSFEPDKRKKEEYEAELFHAKAAIILYGKAQAKSNICTTHIPQENPWGEDFKYLYDGMFQDSSDDCFYKALFFRPSMYEVAHTELYGTPTPKEKQDMLEKLYSQNTLYKKINSHLTGGVFNMLRAIGKIRPYPWNKIPFYHETDLSLGEYLQKVLLSTTCYCQGFRPETDKENHIRDIILPRLKDLAENYGNEIIPRDGL